MEDIIRKEEDIVRMEEDIARMKEYTVLKLEEPVLSTPGGFPGRVESRSRTAPPELPGYPAFGPSPMPLAPEKVESRSRTAPPELPGYPPFGPSPMPPVAPEMPPAPAHDGSMVKSKETSKEKEKVKEKEKEQAKSSRAVPENTPRRKRGRPRKHQHGPNQGNRV
ncbi:hypothetical protein E8E14_005447 [Neopestalotiopsis sp. 37M]|nr:hypothetical protein E8E14_005447 [Neopestalotiopsis sp. 37M]